MATGRRLRRRRGAWRASTLHHRRRQRAELRLGEDGLLDAFIEAVKGMEPSLHLAVLVEAPLPLFAQLFFTHHRKLAIVRPTVEEAGNLLGVFLS